MAQVSISEASRLTGKSRKTLHTYISSGKLTKQQIVKANQRLIHQSLYVFLVKFRLHRKQLIHSM